MKIPFDKKHRKDIESGACRLVYGPAEVPAEVLDWDLRTPSSTMMLVKIALPSYDALEYADDEGMTVSKIPLRLIYPEPKPELTKLEATLLEVFEEVKLCTAGDEDSLKKLAIVFGKDLIEVAREQLQPEIDKELDNAYKNRDEVVYRQGFNEALSLMCWKKIDSDKYDGEDIPLSIVRSTDVDGDYRYHFGTFVYPQQEYIPIADLEKLKPKKFEAQ